MGEVAQDIDKDGSAGDASEFHLFRPNMVSKPVVVGGRIGTNGENGDMAMLGVIQTIIEAVFFPARTTQAICHKLDAADRDLI